MTFSNVQFVYVLLAALACALLIRRMRRRRCFAHSLAYQPIFAELQPSHLRTLPSLIRLLAIVAVGLALMDPRIPSRDRFTRLEGLDIIAVIDLSSSMLEALGGWGDYKAKYEAWARDRSLLERSQGPSDIPIPETRLEAVKNGLSAFVAKRDEDRVALIGFSENTYIISPLTLDHGYLDKYIHLIDGNLLLGEGVSAVGDGIAEAMNMFQRTGDAETRNKVIVVFTDGEHNYGRDPLEVLSEARYYGYRVYLIGVDLGAEVTRKEKLQQLVLAVRETGGEYFDALDREQLDEAYRTIDRMEKGVFVQRTVERNVPVFEWFACLSLLLVSSAAALDAVPYFIDVS